MKLGFLSDFAAYQLIVDRLTMSADQWSMNRFIVCIPNASRIRVLVRHFEVVTAFTSSPVAVIASRQWTRQPILLHPLFVRTQWFIHSLTVLLDNHKKSLSEPFFLLLLLLLTAAAEPLRTEIARCHAQMSTVTQPASHFLTIPDLAAVFPSPPFCRFNPWPLDRTLFDSAPSEDPLYGTLIPGRDFLPRPLLCFFLVGPLCHAEWQTMSQQRGEVGEGGTARVRGHLRTLIAAHLTLRRQSEEVQKNSCHFTPAQELWRLWTNCGGRRRLTCCSKSYSVI